MLQEFKLVIGVCLIGCNGNYSGSLKQYISDSNKIQELTYQRDSLIDELYVAKVKAVYIGNRMALVYYTDTTFIDTLHHF